jgi:ribonuclease III
LEIFVDMDHPRMQSKLNKCQDIIGYEFNNRHLGWEALQMAGNGISRSGGRSCPSGNKRLAIMGDSILGVVLSKPWYDGGKAEG